MKTVYIKEKRKLSKWKLKRIVKKINKLSKKDDIVVAISKKLSENENLIEELEQNKIIILNGRWLFKFLLYDILKYVANQKNKKIETINFAILIKNPEETLIRQITEIAKNVKNLKIVTPKVHNFLYLEEKLYSEYGIAIQVTSNKNKAIANSEIIVNFDFDSEMINKYNICNDAYIINIKKETNIDDLKFNGIIFNNYEIEYNKEILNQIPEKEEFDDNILYESLIYRRDTFLHIRKQLDFDKVKLMRLF